MKNMNDETKAHVKTLARDHWRYVKSVLVAHGVKKKIIKLCGYHYKTAGLHFYKHALEDIAAESEQKGWGSK